MPYARTSELPSSVRNALPPRAQRVFMEAFNGAQKRGLSEERAFASAWGAVKNAGWRPPKGGGKWVKKAAQPSAADVHVDHPMGEEDEDDKKPRRRRRRVHPCQPAAAKQAAEDDDAAASDPPTAIEKSEPPAELPPELEFTFSIAKDADGEPVVKDQNLVFGWLSVVEENGFTVIDAHGHVIEPAELERAAYDFVKNSRIAGEMHERIGVGSMVESFMATKDKQDAMGIDLGRVGWWVGFHVDDEAFAKVKSGELAAFSIGGRGVLEDLEEAA